VIDLHRLGIRHVDLDMTNACNFQCRYCYHSNNLVGDPSQHILPEVKGKMEELIMRFKKNTSKDLNIAFFGGEPMVNFKGIVSMVERTGLRNWGMTSNLSLLREEMIPFFRENHGSVHCSIDGCQEAHDMYRVKAGGASTWNEVARGAMIALKINPNCTARATLMPNNIGLLYKSVIALKDLGFTKAALMTVNEETWTKAHWDIYEQELIKLVDFNVKNPGFYIKNFYDSIRGMNTPKTHNKQPKRCGAGFSMLAVSTNGNVWPCHRFTSTDNTKPWYLGNILEDKIDIAKLKEYQNSFVIPEKCKSCELISSCNMGCPNVSLNLGGLNEVSQAQCDYMERSSKVAKILMKRLSGTNNIYSKMMRGHRNQHRNRGRMKQRTNNKPRSQKVKNRIVKFNSIAGEFLSRNN